MRRDAHCLRVTQRPCSPTLRDVGDKAKGYLHGYSQTERERLHRQARFLEPMVHDRLPYHRRKRLLEVGSGVGAQTEILLRRFPDLHVTGVELNEDQIAESLRFLATVPWATDRYAIVKG